MIKLKVTKNQGFTLSLEDALTSPVDLGLTINSAVLFDFGL